MNMEFGNRLMELRKSEGITRDELANELNMSVNTLRNYENGLREPGHSFVIQMAKRFHVTTDFILGVSNEMKSAQAMISSDAEQLEPDERELVADYRLLNENGKEAARSAVHGFTLAPNYKKSSESKFLEENA